LFAAMGEIHNYSGEGRAPGADGGGESDAGGKPERKTKRGVSAKGVGIRADVEDRGKRGRGQRNVAGAAERVADCGAAGNGGDDPGILGGAAAAGGRGVAGEGRRVPGDPP